MQHGQFDAALVDLAHFDLPFMMSPSTRFASTTSMSTRSSGRERGGCLRVRDATI